MYKISVIIPVYNTEKYLRYALDSIFRQTLHDIEIICINDGSTDGTGRILEEYERRDSRAKVFSQCNYGVSYSRNKGLDIATGEYVFFFDSDDYLQPDALEKCYALAEEKLLDVLFFDGDVLFDGIDEENSTIKWNNYKTKGEYSDVLSGPELFNLVRRNGDYHVPVWLYFFKREYLMNNNIRFIDGIFHEDNAFTFEVFLLAKRMMHVKNSYYIRRVRESSIMTMNKKFEHSYGNFICGLEMIRFFENNKCRWSEKTKENAIIAICSVWKGAMRDYTLIDNPSSEDSVASYYKGLFDICIKASVDNTNKIQMLNNKIDKLKKQIRKRDDIINGMNTKKDSRVKKIIKKLLHS